jgi:glycosyltransferase involved in cell wall biosynthesis
MRAGVADAGPSRSSDTPRSPSPSGRRLRLLVISSDTFPPTRVDVAVLFGEELAQRGHRIDYILQSEQPCAAAYVTNWGGGRVWVGRTDLGTSLLSRILKHTRGVLHDLRLFGRIRSGDYDLIQVKDKFISGLLAVLAARAYRKRFVFWLSYPIAEEYLLKGREGKARYPTLYVIRGAVSKFLLYRMLLRAADHIFVQSEKMRQDIAQHGIRPEKMTPVPMGFKPERFGPASGNTGRTLIPAAEPCFLYLGTLNRVRRLDFLVRVLAQVREEIPRAKLYIVGGGDHPGDEQLLLQEAARLGVTDALVLLGKLPQSEALRYVQEADVCVSPFFPTPILNSTSPTKLVEYLAMAKAVVATDHPEQRSVIEESGGGLCVPWEEGAFAAAVVRLLRAPDTAARMGECGRRYVLEHRSYVKIADLVEAALRRILTQVDARGR